LYQVAAKRAEIQVPKLDPKIRGIAVSRLINPWNDNATYITVAALEDLIIAVNITPAINPMIGLC